jgi:glutamate synthase domain-containing protein 2
MVPDTEENRGKCICPDCPSYPQGCGGELLYCSTGKSKCDIAAAGCVCNTCPVWFENNLKELYFCDKEPVGESRSVMRKKHPLEDASFYQAIVDIKDIAATGRSIVRSMGSLKRMPVALGDLHFVPAQVARMPLNAEEAVGTEVVIGAKAKRPLRVSSPIMISGMSYGATSKSVRTVISRTAAALKIAFNAGEGGILEEELSAAGSYLIGQYATGRFGVDEARLRRVAAIEIRFGQGAYPGKGSYLPAGKITPEIAAVRGLKPGEAAYSPARHPDMRNAQEVSEKLAWLRSLTGVPIGAKIGCGNVEADVRLLVEAGVDFIALDGFGGGTGATDAYVRENVGIPIIAALPRAAKTLEEAGARQRISLIAGGGLRTSADFAKCLALGADAVYVGTAALIAINCEQYRICHTGLCPTGITTHKPELERQLNVAKGVERLTNFITACTREIAMFARVVGKDDVKKLDRNDLVALTKDAAALTGTRWLGGL